MKRLHYYVSASGETSDALTLTEVKKRIRKEGGSGYTQHFDRDGSFQESTPIVKGNNARTTYRAEYNTSRKFRDRGQNQTGQTEINVAEIINKVVVKAKALNLGEGDDAQLMDLLGSELGERAGEIKTEWYDRTLCYIHGRLFHEYRGFIRYGKRMDAIEQWKKMKKEQ